MITSMTTIPGMTCLDCLPDLHCKLDSDAEPRHKSNFIHHVGNIAGDVHFLSYCGAKGREVGSGMVTGWSDKAQEGCAASSAGTQRA